MQPRARGFLGQESEKIRRDPVQASPQLELFFHVKIKYYIRRKTLTQFQTITKLGYESQLNLAVLELEFQVLGALHTEQGGGFVCFLSAQHETC